MLKQIPTEKEKKKEFLEVISGGIHLVLRILQGNVRDIQQTTPFLL